MAQTRSQRSLVKPVNPPSGEAGNYFGRVGTIVLTAPEDADLKALYPKVATAIRADSRVVSVVVPKLNPHWIGMDALYPASVKDTDSLFRGSDRMFGVRYPTPFAIEISVPAKNQPQIHGELAASDRYLAAWDGWTAVILWPKGASKFAPASAGQVLIEILTDAMTSLDLGIYVQACSPNCELKFAHKAMVVAATDGAASDTKFVAAGPDPVQVKVVLDGNFPLAPAVHQEVSLPATEFSQVKNLSRRILNLEAAAREMTSELIALDYMALSKTQASRWQRIRRWFHDLRYHRGEGGARRARFLIASLWLAMASIELLQQRFAGVRRSYEDSVERWAVPELFERDLKSDEAEVESIDAQFARAAIEYKSTRIDSRIVVVATIVAGLAGGILGLLGALFTLSAGAGA